jgi:zinc/manganese transport system substrate-binding protein
MRNILFGLLILVAASMSVAQEPIKVLATYSILGDFVQNVGGDLIDLTVLVGPDGDAHEYEATPQDSVAIADAALIFENGLAFETWLDDLYTASGSSATRVVVSEGVELLETSELESEAEHHSEFDPHIWHDPKNAMVMVDNIAAALSKADSNNAAIYLANAKGYKAELEQLDIYIKTQVEKIPVEKRKLVTSHDVFAYFAKSYGFEVIGTVISSVTTESSDASARELADLIDLVKASGVSAIFAENIINTDLLEQVANAAGVVIAPSLYTDALGQEGTPGASYLEMQRYNIDTIVAALNQ